MGEYSIINLHQKTLASKSFVKNPLLWLLKKGPIQDRFKHMVQATYAKGEEGGFEVIASIGESPTKDSKLIVTEVVRGAAFSCKRTILTGEDKIPKRCFMLMEFHNHTYHENRKLESSFSWGDLIPLTQLERGSVLINPLLLTCGKFDVMEKRGENLLLAFLFIQATQAFNYDFIANKDGFNKNLRPLSHQRKDLPRFYSDQGFLSVGFSALYNLQNHTINFLLNRTQKEKLGEFKIWSDKTEEEVSKVEERIEQREFEEHIAILEEMDAELSETDAAIERKIELAYKEAERITKLSQIKNNGNYRIDTVGQSYKEFKSNMEAYFEKEKHLCPLSKILEKYGVRPENIKEINKYYEEYFKKGEISPDFSFRLNAETYMFWSEKDELFSQFKKVPEFFIAKQIEIFYRKKFVNCQEIKLHNGRSIRFISIEEVRKQLNQKNTAPRSETLAVLNAMNLL